jgi:hypothetical protein
MSSSSKTRKFYAIHGEPAVYFKWFGKGGCGPATKGRKGGINFHGFPEKEAAEYYLSIPNVEAANQWARTHGKGGKWKDHAPKIEPIIDTNDLPPLGCQHQLRPRLRQSLTAEKRQGLDRKLPRHLLSV